MSCAISCAEVRIPVSWGHLAAKWWGRQERRPIVTIHSWQDNCGTFDLLIPQLPKHIGYLAIDLPGHGHSSWLPPSMFYHSIDSVSVLRTIQKYFKWEKMSFMGHSLGAITAYSYGMLYPSSVYLMVCLDALHSVMENFVKLEEQSRSTIEPASHTFEEIAQKLHLSSRRSIDLDKCELIYRRNIHESKVNPGHYYYRTQDSSAACS